MFKFKPNNMPSDLPFQLFFPPAPTNRAEHYSFVIPFVRLPCDHFISGGWWGEWSCLFRWLTQAYIKRWFWKLVRGDPFGAERQKEGRLWEEPCLFNPTHWYADARVASRSLNGWGILAASPLDTFLRRRTLWRAANDMQPRILKLQWGPINNHIVSSYFMSGGKRGRTKLPPSVFEIPPNHDQALPQHSELCVFLCLRLQEFGIILMMCELDHSFTLPLIHYYGQMCTKYIIMGLQWDGHETWMSLSGMKTAWKKNRIECVWCRFRAVLIWSFYLQIR